MEQAAGELVFQVGQDDRSVTLAYGLKGLVRGHGKEKLKCGDEASL